MNILITSDCNRKKSRKQLKYPLRVEQINMHGICTQEDTIAEKK